MKNFHFVEERRKRTEKDVQMAQQEAQDWSIEEIFNALQQTAELVRCTGYARELRMRCKEMRDWELKELYHKAFKNRNAMACNVIMPIIKERNLTRK